MQYSPGRFVLAASLWPRQVYDFGNRSQVPTWGPPQGRIRAWISLPTPANTGIRGSGIAVLTDGLLCVVYGGYATAFTLAGNRLWTYLLTDLPEGGADVTDDMTTDSTRVGTNHLDYHSPPVALATAEIVLSLPNSYLILNRQGTRTIQQAIGGGDDSGYAPNLTLDGALVLTSMFGDITIVEANQQRALGIGFGYDIVPPAVYADGSLAVAGYYGTGFCRVQLNGQFLWQTDFHEADLQPSLSHEDIAGVGSLNDACTRFFALTGQQIGEYPQAARLACYSQSEWIAGARGYLARLDPTGHVEWEQEHESLRLTQPITDAVGHIYSVTDSGITGWDGTGHVVFHVATEETPADSLALVAPGVLACIVGETLLLVE